MKNYYGDIIARIPTPPLWFDEHGVPRYEAFGPRLTANVYSSQVAYLEIACQNCDTRFMVCLSWGEGDMARKIPDLRGRVEQAVLEYGDPPNALCCPAGPTMNSIPMRVHEFWVRDRETFEWVRDRAYERNVVPEWAAEK